MPKATKAGASNQWAFPPLSEEQVEALHPEVAEAREAAEQTAPDYSEFTVVELVSELAERDLPTSGRKADLVARLVASDDGL